MKITSKIILFFTLGILGFTLSSCKFIVRYAGTKALDCVLLGNCPSLPKGIICSSSAKQALRDYYDKINSRSYQKAWNSLSYEFQQNSKLHPQGYNSYENWWTQVEKVNVLNVVQIQQKTYHSIVNLKLQYVMSQSYRESYDDLRLNLVLDADTNCWLIDSVKPL